MLSIHFGALFSFSMKRVCTRYLIVLFVAACFCGLKLKNFFFLIFFCEIKDCRSDSTGIFTLPCSVNPCM